ncbi:MAG: glycosyltransferase 87 family protein [Candidatus Bruticola sp.]
MNGNSFIKENKTLVICWLLLFILSAAGWLMHPKFILFLQSPAENGGGYDFFHYYASVQALKSGLANIYDPVAMRRFSVSLSEGRWAVFDNHPLPFYLFYLPFSQGSLAQGYLCHAFWQYFLYAAGLLLLCRNLIADSLKSWITWALLAAGSFSWGLWIDNLLLGQVGGFFVFCLAIVVVSAWKKQDFWCGLALAVAVLLKLYPALLLIWLISKRRYQAVAYTILSLFLLSLSAGLQWGFFRFSQYCRFLFTEQKYPEAISNQSVMSIINNCLYDMPPIVIKFINIFIIAFVVYALWKSSCNSRQAAVLTFADSEAAQALDSVAENHDKCDTANTISGNFSLFTAEYGVWILATLIISPLSWSHHHIVTVIPLLAVISLLAQGNIKCSTKLLWSCVIVACLLILTDSETMHNAAVMPLFYTIFQYKLILGLLIVWEILLYLLMSNCRSTASACNLVKHN